MIVGLNLLAYLLPLGLPSRFEIITRLNIPPYFLKRHPFRLRLRQHPQDQIKYLKKPQTMVIREPNRQAEFSLFQFLQEHLEILLPLRPNIRMPAHHHLIEDDPHRIHITQWISLIIQFHEFLRGDIIESSISFIGEFVTFVEYRESEVRQLVDTPVDEYILWFEILMENLLIEEHFVTSDELIEDVEGLLLCEGSFCFHLVEESTVFAVLHDDVVVAL